MPCAILSSKSTLLTAHGWCKAESQAEVLGVDRHGKVVSASVDIAALPAPARVGFLASKDSFGYFSAKTRLVDSTGAARLVSSLVESGDVGNVRFETITEIGDIAPSDDSASALWISFGNFAAVKNPTTAILRCRTPNKKLADNVELFLSVRRFGQHYYSILSREAFVAALCRDWSHTSDALAAKWLSTPEGTLEFHRDQFLFALWVLSSRKRRKQGVSLQFEARQYTTRIFMAPAAAPTLSGGAGASCFYLAGEESALEIRWSDRSWNPISSGFLLASN